MSFNQSRSDRNEAHHRKSGGRSSSFNQQRGSTTSYGREAGAGAVPSPSSSLPSNRSYNKKGSNAQGAQYRVNVPAANHPESNSNTHVVPRNAQNSSHAQPQFHGASDVLVASSAAKPTDSSNTQRSTKVVPKAPTSQHATMNVNGTTPTTPPNGPGDAAAKGFAFQFESISPGLMNIMHVPTRTSSAPPNLYEQESDQVRRESFRPVGPVPSLPTPAPAPAPKPQLPRKDVGQSNDSEGHPVPKTKKDLQIPPSTFHVSQMQKPSIIPVPMTSVQLPFQQPQVQFGVTNPPIQSQGMAAPSLQMAVQMQMANAPQQQPVLFQHHPMQSQGIMHQDQGLNFSNPMRFPMPHMSNMALGINPPYAQQQGGKFDSPRKTTFKITDPRTPEELRLDKRTEIHSDGSSDARQHPNLPPQNQTFSPSHPMKYYSNSYTPNPMYYPSATSRPLTSGQMAPNSQASRFNYPVSQGPRNVHSATVRDVHGMISFAPSGTGPVTVKPAVGSLGEKIVDSPLLHSSAAVEKSVPLKTSRVHEISGSSQPLKDSKTVSEPSVSTSTKQVVGLSNTESQQSVSLSSPSVAPSEEPQPGTSSNDANIKESVKKGPVPPQNPVGEHSTSTPTLASQGSENDTSSNTGVTEMLAANTIPVPSIVLAGNYGGAQRNPRVPYPGDILSALGKSMGGPQAGFQRNNHAAEKWQCAPANYFQQRGLIPSPPTPFLTMHKAERKYEVGKVTDEEQAKQRQLKAILNKLTPQNFDRLFQQVNAVNIDNVVTLAGVTSQIFDRALTEPTFCQMYANFCFHLSKALPELIENNEKVTFKRLFLNKCQEEFERGEREQEEANQANEGTVNLSDGEREEKRVKARRRTLGIIRLIGELYKKRMLTERIMHECINNLLRQYPDPDEEDVEALCKLMSTIGEMIDHSKAKEHMDYYFQLIEVLSNNMNLSSRVRFMLRDSIDLRSNKWQEGRKVNGLKKIEEVHRQRQLKAILNKLTPQNFDRLFQQVNAVNIDNVVTLAGVTSQIFDRALTEPTFCQMYANFCFHLSKALPELIENNEKVTFKGLLLNKCQEEFERGEREQEEASQADEGTVNLSDGEREEKRVKARRRMLGNIRLIGELYKKRMLTERIMHECIKKLLRQYPDPDEEDVEALCKLMSTIGEMIDHSKAKEHMDYYFQLIEVLSNNMNLSSRVRFMLRDSIDLRSNKWQERRKVNGLKKIEEVHRQRQLKAILNKLTPQNFDRLFQQVNAVNIDNVVTPAGVTSQIFDRALTEPTFCQMYANFCFHLSKALPELIENNEKVTFKGLLLNKCQEEFERGEREQEEASQADEGTVNLSDGEREEKRVKARRRMLGNIRLIGELYKKRMLTERIMHECIKKLLRQYPDPDEEDVEALCKLMSTIGEMIDHSKAKEHMDYYFQLIEVLSNNMNLSSRVRFMLRDSIDLRSNKWQERRKVNGLKKIEEVHRQRQLKAILNKLTPQNFDRLFQQVNAVNIDNVVTLAGVTSQIFDRALTEPTFCQMYANFCFHLSKALPELIENNEKVTFKGLLLNKCQEEFERGEREQEEASQADEGTVNLSDGEREEKRVKARRRMLGNIRLIGELYKKRMLTERIMHECIKKLLRQYPDPDEEDVEALCKLMSTIGEMIDHSKAKEHMDYYFQLIEVLSNNMNLSSRVRFMLRDSIDLRSNKWQERRKVNGLKKIEEVHRQRQLKAILNKLTPQNFDRLFQQVNAVNIDNVVTLAGVTSQIFDRALMEPTFYQMYANFCFHLSKALPELIENNEKVTFKGLLLNKCQEEFERGEREQEEASQADEGTVNLSDGEREEKRVKARRRTLGNIRLIGELYKKRMLTERIMHECIKKLLRQYPDSDEEDVEALCKLMSTIGEMIDHSKAKEHMDYYFQLIEVLSNNMNLSSRVRFMLRDSIDLRSNKWQEGRKVNGPKKIEEVHRQRQLKAILNKLTPQNFDRLFQQVNAVNIDNVVTLAGVTSQIFDRALTEPTFCQMYANFCFHLSKALPELIENNEKVTFKGLLLNKCQEEFERGEREQEEASQADEGTVNLSDGEREEKRVKARRRTLGIIRLIGELYKKRMLTERIMHECIKKLLRQYPDSDEEDVEALCKLMSTIGEMIDHSKAKEHMDYYFQLIEVLSNNMNLSSRVRFMLRDSIDLRSNKWQERKKIDGPKKIEEVHMDAAQECQKFESVLATLEDVVNDAPKAPEFLGSIFAIVVRENVVSLIEIGRLLRECGEERGSLLDFGLASDVLGNTLENIKSEKGEAFLNEIRTSSSLQVENTGFEPQI